MPFLGVYAALTGNSFTGTLQWRHSNYDLNLTNPDIGASNQELNAHGDTFSADAAYTYPVAPGYYITPSAAVFVSHTNVNNLYVNEAFAQNTEFTFDALKSTLGRFGARASTVYTFNDNLLVAPFVAANVWHEFQGGSTTTFEQGVATIANPVPPVVSSSLGTFGQFSVGLSTQSPKSGLTSYIQGDVRVGSNVQGWGVTGGLRYSY